MDLAEKRKQLEAVRAARQAKQQVVDQYMNDRSVSSQGSPNASQLSSLAPSAASQLPPPPTATSAAVAPRSPRSGSGTTGAATATRSGSSSGGVKKGRSTGPLTPPPSAPTTAASAKAEPKPVVLRAAPKAPTQQGTSAPTTPPAQKARTALSASSSLLPLSPASPLLPHSPAGATGAAIAGAAPMIQVLSVSSSPHNTPLPVSASGGVAGSAGLSGSFPSPPPPSVIGVGAAVTTTVPAMSDIPAADPRTAQKGTTHWKEEMRAAPGAHQARAGGWGLLQHCVSAVARDAASSRGTPTRPVCVFNPAVVLGDVTGTHDSSRRRVILDSTACLVPYEGAAAARRNNQSQGNGGSSHDGADGDGTVWSVCVAATYGANEPVYGGVGSSSGAVAGASATAGGDALLSSHVAAHRRNSGESAAFFAADGRTSASLNDAHTGGNNTSSNSLWRGAGGSNGGGGGGGGNGGGSAGPSRNSAAAALAGVRASMECGYPWGSAAAAHTAIPGHTMDAMLKVGKDSPGLVLTWFVVPLPAAAQNAGQPPQREGGEHLLGLSAASSSMPADGAGGGIAPSAATPEYVVVVLPLVCDSEVTTLLAHPFQPSTLLGGTRCGRVVQWSMGQAWSQVEPRRLIERALATTGTPTTVLLPPQRPAHSSFPSPQAHQAPVLRMAIHGDASCHHLYSISQEGKVCTWPAWQPLHPTASCLSYLGIRPMGNIGVAAQFVERPGTDAMTRVFIGTASGALLVGANRDAKSIELQYYGPPRAVPTSSTVIKTLDVTAYAATAAAAAPAPPDTQSSFSRGLLTPRTGSISIDSPPLQGGQRPQEHASAGVGASAAARRGGSSVPPPHTSSQPHHGRIVAMTLQTAAHGFRGRDCVVSAATDGNCVAWFDRTAMALEGFSSAVTSVCWSPTKASVLAAGDASGLVTVWAVNISIITPVGTVSLREAGRRTRGSAASDGVLWVVSGPSDAAGYGGAAAAEAEEDADESDTDASLGQTDTVGTAISSVFFSRDGRWLFASTACGYVYSIRVSASLA